jgi:hypothetical protein
VFEKGNKLASKNKGKKQRKTIIQEKMGLKWSDAEIILEKNILEFMNSKSPKTRLIASNYFSKFIKPAKTEVKEVKLTFEEYLSEQQNQKSPSNEPEPPVNKPSISDDKPPEQSLQPSNEVE